MSATMLRASRHTQRKTPRKRSKTPRADIALARGAVYQQSLRNYHSLRVRGRSFEPGVLVLHLKQTSMKKMEPPWDGHILSRRSYLAEHIAFATSSRGRTKRTRGTQRSCAISTPRKSNFLFPFFVKKVTAPDRTPYYAFSIYQ
jgi:hypothetical protein